MDDSTLLDQVARIIYEEGLKGAADASVRGFWPGWNDLPKSCAKDCAYSAAKSILALISVPASKPS